MASSIGSSKTSAQAPTRPESRGRRRRRLAADIEALRAIVVVVVAVASVQLLVQSTLGQVLDGDEQFQAYHQDIGRISGSNSPVAAQTVLTTRQQQQQQPLLASAAPATLVPSSRPAQQQQRGSQQLLQPSRGRQSGSASSSGRLTLTMRQFPSSGESFSLSASSAAPAPLEPQPQPAVEPVFTQLAAPPQFKPMGVVSASSVQSAPLRARQAAAAPSHHQFSSSVSSNAPGPALTSFRSGLSNSVSARHSALMAQVAAERQQAAAVAGPDFFQAAQQQQPQAASSANSALSLPQASLGSPLAALSQPALTQVQPPPAAAASQHQAAASSAQGFVDQPEEPLVAPSFEHVLSQGCPKKGVFSYENKDHCDRYYICTNGTFTEEACPNGLAYSQMGAVYQHCAYNWNVNCGNKKTSEPLASPGCPWQFGIFPVASAGQCSIDYFVCEWGVPETKRCQPEGLFYDDRIKGCQWADQLGCKSEALLNFKCPAEDEDNPYWPYPRYYHTNKDIIVCVSEQPRLVHCNEDQIVDPSSLACLDLKKKKKGNRIPQQ